MSYNEINANKNLQQTDMETLKKLSFWTQTQSLLNQNRYKYHIKFTKKTPPIYNSQIFLIHNESKARWETSIKVIILGVTVCHVEKKLNPSAADTRTFQEN